VDLSDVDVGRRPPRLLERSPGGDDGRVQRGRVPAVLDREGVAGDLAARYPQRGVGVALGKLERPEDDRRRAVRERRAVEDPQRLGDRPRPEDLIERDLVAVVGVGVARAHLVRLHRNARELLAGRAVLVHVAPGDQRPQCREGSAEDDLPFVVGGGARDLVAGGVGDVGELFGPPDDHEVVEPARHREVALVEGERARGAAGLDAHAGQVATPEPGVVEDQRGDVLLVDERARGHVAEVEGPEVGGGEPRVHERLEPGLDSDLAERAVPQLAELRHAGAEDGDLAHPSSPPCGSCRGTSRRPRS